MTDEPEGLWWRATCARCGDHVRADDPGHVVLSCMDVLTPYTKRDQTTRVERRTHGLGRPQ